VGQAEENAGFTEIMLPHLDAAYNLARWLTGDAADAADVVQDAMLRGLRFFGTFRGSNAKAWILAIVRNTAYSWIKANRRPEIAAPRGCDADAFDRAIAEIPTSAEDPEAALIRSGERRKLDRLIAALSPEFRECLVLREIEDMSYKEIAQVTGVPIGTVMSRLARARRLMQRAWMGEEA
jgi:RNA polymerase sigma-70 factor (ECF subfamily)